MINRAGFSVVEMMISMTIGLFISLAAISLLISSKAAYSAQDDQVEMQETGRYALEAIARAIRQAGYENPDKEGVFFGARATLSANVGGLDARSLKSGLPAIDSPITPAVNGSDVLSIRYFGAGTGLNGDGTIINCAGFGVGATTQESAETERGWSIFYVANDSAGEPELRCKYKGKSGWSSEAIARGVEAFQVLYGLDTDGDGLANQFLRATDLNALDEALVLTASVEPARTLEKNAKSHWKKIVAVKVGILVRGRQPARADQLTRVYDLLGVAYSDINASIDSGVRLNEAIFSIKIRNRVRKIFSSTFWLRNPAATGSV